MFSRLPSVLTTARRLRVGIFVELLADQYINSYILFVNRVRSMLFAFHRGASHNRFNNIDDFVSLCIVLCKSRSE